MVTTSVKHGLRAIFVEARVAVLLWLANLALVVIALPAIWSWWSRTSLLPEADPLLERFHAGIFRDLLIDGGANGLLTMLLTALGLLIAIPSVLAFNVLTARADKIVLELERSRGEFLDHLEHTAVESAVTQETEASRAA